MLIDEGTNKEIYSLMYEHVELVFANPEHDIAYSRFGDYFPYSLHEFRIQGGKFHGIVKSSTSFSVRCHVVWSSTMSLLVLPIKN